MDFWPKPQIFWYPSDIKLYEEHLKVSIKRPGCSKFLEFEKKEDSFKKSTPVRLIGTVSKTTIKTVE